MAGEDKQSGPSGAKTFGQVSLGLVTTPIALGTAALSAASFIIGGVAMGAAKVVSRIPLLERARMPLELIASKSIDAGNALKSATKDIAKSPITLFQKSETKGSSIPNSQNTIPNSSTRDISQAQGQQNSSSSKSIQPTIISNQPTPAQQHIINLGGSSSNSPKQNPQPPKKGFLQSLSEMIFQSKENSPKQQSSQANSENTAGKAPEKTFLQSLFPSGKYNEAADQINRGTKTAVLSAVDKKYSKMAEEKKLQDDALPTSSWNIGVGGVKVLVGIATIPLAVLGGPARLVTSGVSSAISLVARGLSKIAPTKRLSQILENYADTNAKLASARRSSAFGIALSPARLILDGGSNMISWKNNNPWQDARNTETEKRFEQVKVLGEVRAPSPEKVKELYEQKRQDKYGELDANKNHQTYTPTKTQESIRATLVEMKTFTAISRYNTKNTGSQISNTAGTSR